MFASLATLARYARSLSIIYHAKSRLNTPVWGSLRSPNYCAINNIMGLLVKHKLYRLMLRAEMEEVNLCVGCAEDITASRIKRKLTGGVANVVGIIVEIFEEVLPVGSTLDTCKLLNSYVCRPCFRSMERILKLREEGASAFRDACNKARGSIHCIPLLHQDAADPGSDEEDSLHPPPAKRQRLRSDEEDSLHPPPAKRQRLQDDSLHPPPAKRQCLQSNEEDSLHPPSAKCQCLFIPVIDSSISEKSPAVSV